MYLGILGYIYNFTNLESSLAQSYNFEFHNSFPLLKKHSITPQPFSTLNQDNILVIAEDFNCGDVDWGSGTGKPDAYERAPNKKPRDLANNCSLTNVQQQVTHRGRAPDLYLTTNSSLRV